MVKKEELFVLIKSLTQAEKRYFKIFCGQTAHQTANAKYLKLFEAIDNQEVYDEDQIREIFKNEKSMICQYHFLLNYRIHLRTTAALKLGDHLYCHALVSNKTM